VYARFVFSSVALLASAIAMSASLRSASTDAPRSNSKFTSPAGTRAPLAKASGVVTLDYPGAVFTEATGITAGGKIVGAYDLGDGALHGYFYSQGSFVGFDGPEFALIEPEGISNRGDVVGAGVDVNFTGLHGWLRTADGTFSQIDFPGAGLTEALAINSRQVIVGVYRDAIHHGHGFVLDDGQFETLDVPGATFSAAVGIDDDGDIVGNYHNGDGVLHGFLLRKGRFETIDGPNATFTTAAGITPSGEITGVYIDSVGHHGYRLVGGVFQAIDGPNALLTEAYGINPAGDVVGVYIDLNGNGHGFFSLR
jgi:hypothetical protein